MEYSAEGRERLEQVKRFMDDFIYPNEAEYFEQLQESDDPHFYPPLMDKLCR